MTAPGDAGGSAAAGGFDYQARCAAWFATRILARNAAPPAPPMWTSALRRIECETGEPVDDSKLVQDVGPPVVVQCKRTIDLSVGVDSELAKTVGQFVEHHQLDGHSNDTMLLVTSSQASGRVRNTLRSVLDRIREAALTTDVADLSFNEEEKRAHMVFVGHLDRAWRDKTGTTPTGIERRALLRRCHVFVLDVDPGGSHETDARQLLRSVVVADPSFGDAAWAALIERCARLAADRSGADFEQLQQHVLTRGIRLRTVLDYHEDVARLEAAADMALLELETGLVTIPAPEGAIQLTRQSVDDMVREGAAGPLLVVGDPGVGKTVALHHLARHEIAAGRPVFFVSAGSMASTSLGELRNELGLEHELPEVLAQWSPGVAKLVIIDALDAARNDPQADLWRKFIDFVNTQLPEWHVVASVRTWDLQHSPRLRAQFPGAPGRLAELDDVELDLAVSSWPELAELLDSAPSDFRQLLRNPFNLRLAAELLLAGTGINELREIRDRLGLLDRYWQERVVDGEGGSGRQSIVSRVCDIAVRRRTFTAAAADVVAGDTAAAGVLDVLLSRSVLRDATAVPGTPGVGAIRFAHHVFFDYAVAVTIFAPTEQALTERLHNDPDLVLFARPSIDMHLDRLWTADPSLFWKHAFAIVADEDLPRLAAVAIAEVAARRAVELDELAPLIDPIVDGNASPAQQRILRYLALAVVIDRQDGDNPRPEIWPRVVERLSDNVATTELPLRILLTDLLQSQSL